METCPELQFSGRRISGTDHRLLVATPPLRIESRKMAPSNQFHLNFRRLREEGVTQDYKRELAESLGEPNDSDDSEKLD